MAGSASFRKAPLVKTAGIATVYVLAMEILNELFFYNRTDNPLSSPMRVRIAAHTGPIRYSANSLELLKNETLKEVIAIESDSTPADAMSASLNIFLPIDRVIQDCFGPELRVADNKVRQYSICVEGRQ